MEKVKTNYVSGGIGDFLQFLPFSLKNKDEKFLIHTHYKKAKDFYDFFSFQNIEYLFFDNVNEFIEQKKRLTSDEKIELKIAERDLFYKFPIFQELENENRKLINSFLKTQKIIGIHPFGSFFSNTYAKSNNLITKNISKEVIYESFNDKFNYLIFGTEEEIFENDFFEKENVKFVCYSNIVKSLYAVKICNLFIGTDSCFKNMACMNQIKTYCILGDYKDDFRDMNFVTPYVNERVLEFFKITKETSQTEIKKYINYCSL
jgi:hypothetical protein